MQWLKFIRVIEFKEFIQVMVYMYVIVWYNLDMELKKVFFFSLVEI